MLLYEEKLIAFMLASGALAITAAFFNAIFIIYVKLMLWQFYLH
jgi:hypothetical protein